MADLNTTSTVNGAMYAGGARGYAAAMQQTQKYEKALLAMLNAGNDLGHTKYLLHKVMPQRLGDSINMRRYFSLETDPTKLKLDKNAITGPALKKVAGAAVEAKLEWYGNGIELNDFLETTHLDDIMRIYMPELYRNAKVVMDNIAALAMYDGASKAFIKSYDATKDTGSVTLGAVAETAGPLNHDILRSITATYLNNTETYKVPDGQGGTTDVTVPAVIKPHSGGRYTVLTSAQGMDDLVSDEKFKKDAVRGINASSLEENVVTNFYRYKIETISNHLTVKKADGKPQTDWLGDLQVAFVFGKDFGFDVKMAGQGLKVYTKSTSEVDTGDKYGRLAFTTYKMAYVAKVANSAAITAVVFKPGSLVSGAVVAPTVVNPKQ